MTAEITTWQMQALDAVVCTKRTPWTGIDNTELLLHGFTSSMTLGYLYGCRQGDYQIGVGRMWSCRVILSLATATPTAAADWWFWQQALQQCLGLNRWWKLPSFLSKWFPPTSRQFYNSVMDCLWQHEELGWTFFTVVPHRFQSCQFHSSGSIDSPPHLTTSWYKAMMNRCGSYCCLTGYGAIYKWSQVNWVALMHS